MRLFIESGRFEQAQALANECIHLDTDRMDRSNTAQVMLDYACLAHPPIQHLPGWEAHAQAVVSGLLRAGAGVDQFTFGGALTALQLAVGENNMVMARSLLAMGADPNKLGKQNEDTCLKMVCNDNADMARLLIDHGANVHLPCGWGDEPILWHAAVRGDVNIMKTLVEAGADVHHVDCNGNNLLHHMIERTHRNWDDLGRMREAFRMVGMWGVDMHAANTKGETPTEMADTMHERTQALSVLAEVQAALQAQALQEEVSGRWEQSPRPRL